MSNDLNRLVSEKEDLSCKYDALYNQLVEMEVQNDKVEIEKVIHFSDICISSLLYHYGRSLYLLVNKIIIN